jgi:hypothetical protein
MDLPIRSNFRTISLLLGRTVLKKLKLILSVFLYAIYYNSL